MSRPTRDSYFRIMVSAREHREFNELAAKRHTTVSELIRQLLYRELDSQKAQAA